MIRRDVFESIGGFDEDFFLSHEDVDLSYRVQLLGFCCLYVPDAIVWHAGSATLGRISPRAVFYGQRNLEWVFVKDTPWPLLVASLPAHALYSLAAGVYYTAIGFGAPFTAAKWAAMKGLPAMWRKRRGVHAGAVSGSRRMAARVGRGWVRL
jgi:GT2 family glycosyltransferase